MPRTNGQTARKMLSSRFANSQQHEAQALFVNALKAAAAARTAERQAVDQLTLVKPKVINNAQSSSKLITLTNSTSNNNNNNNNNNDNTTIKSKVNIINRARKSFHDTKPESKATVDNDDESMMNGKSISSSMQVTCSSPSLTSSTSSMKKKRRHYRGGTYDLYITRKLKKNKRKSNGEDELSLNDNEECSSNVNGDSDSDIGNDNLDTSELLTVKNRSNEITTAVIETTVAAVTTNHINSAENVSNEKDSVNKVNQTFEKFTDNTKSSSNKNKREIKQVLLQLSVTNEINDEGDDNRIKFVVMNDIKTNIQQTSCLCTEKPIVNKSESSKTKPLFCQAIDSFDGKLIGCCNQARLTSLFRASKRVPYRVFCEVHLARLRRHHCCPSCGVFCSQGEFLECFAIRKQVHLFHKNCQNVQDLDLNKQHCPHCNNVSDLRCVRLEMNGSVSNIYYLTQNPSLKTPKAKITLNKLSELTVVKTQTDEPGLEYLIPETKKTLSLAGLPLGPSRKQLENLLAQISNEKQSPSIRLTNKNFHSVAKSGDVEKVLAILAQGFDPNYTFEENDNETPLHAAAASGSLVVVHLLIQAGASPNVLNKNMHTPLTLAILGKYGSIVKYLIKAGASCDIRGEDGMTSLHVAARHGSTESVFHILNSGKIKINLQDDGGWTALVWATEHKHLSIVRMLLNKGADPNILDDEENCGLHWAAYSGDVNIAFIYIEMGANINATNLHGDTPLHIGARRDNYECVVLLLSRGADLTLLNKNQETPLMCCIKNSQSALALKINNELKRYTSTQKLNSDKYLHKDVSKGKEYYQIPIVNGVDTEPVPIDFMYITENCETSPISIDRSITSLQSCRCEDDCSSDKCLCALISFRCWYDREGKLVPEFNLQDSPMIFECNRACSCWKTCYNRVVQFGVSRARLQVYRTKTKGWGVRPLKDIPRGTFVCEYVGEIITDSEADRREDDSYLFDLDNRDGETYCLDARFYGNVSRFINHSCTPNLTPVKVFVDHQDLSFPKIALFANRDIKAFEELGFDYGEKFWVIKYRWFTCDCGSNECKYSKDTIGHTLENYYKKVREDLTHDTSANNNQVL